MCLGKRAVLLAAVAGALLSASVARANGDPASDYLLTQNVFLPFTQTIPVAQSALEVHLVKHSFLAVLQL